MIKRLIVLGILNVSLLQINPLGVNAEWRKDNHGWWYSEGSSYYTGWYQIDGKWYYFYADGYMANNTCIDGYYVDQTGAWVENNIQKAKNLIYKADGKFISKNIEDSKKNNNEELSLNYIGEGEVGKFINTEAWNINEGYGYVFSLSNEYDEVCGYFVSCETNNVYCIPHQGGLSLYKMENNRVSKVFYYMNDAHKSYEWR